MAGAINKIRRPGQTGFVMMAGRRDMNTNWHRKNDVTKLGWTGLGDPHYCAMLARAGFDGLVLDMQHGFLDESAVLACIGAAAGAGCPVIVRVPLDRWDLASRVLDFGAAGVIAPMISTAAQAQQLVDATKYTPTGVRSYGPRYAAQMWGMDGKTYITQANDFTLTLAMVETREAVENIDSILAVDGLDGIYVGPADLSISVRGNPVPDVFGPDTVEIIRDLGRKTRAAGKYFAAFTANPDHANLFHDMGGNMISIGDEAVYMAKGAEFCLTDLAF